MDEFRAPDALVGEYAPLLRKRLPYWRPKAPACHTEFHLPVWGKDGTRWERHDLAELRSTLPRVAQQVSQRMVELDVNAAWPAAASTVLLAHGSLTHTRFQAFDGSPGYWLVDLRAIEWDDVKRDLASPLGTNRHRDQAWLASPTVALLTELAQEGVWPELTILDSWTCEDRCRLNKWAERIKIERNALHDVGDRERLDALKISYAQAVEMLLKGDKFKAHRPDWAHTIFAQHAASTWRKMWRATQAGHGPVAMGNVDAVTFMGDDLIALQGMNPPPVRLDQYGRTYGTFKVTTTDTAPKELLTP